MNMLYAIIIISVLLIFCIPAFSAHSERKKQAFLKMYDADQRAAKVLNSRSAEKKRAIADLADVYNQNARHLSANIISI